MARAYDIAVLGASAAGYVAALALARRGRNAIVVDCPFPPTESPLADWAPADVFATDPAARRLRKSGTDSPFRAVHFHSEDLARRATYRSRSVLGFLLRSGRLLSALARAARKAGVEQRRLTERPVVHLEESAVVLGGTRPVRASLLLMARGAPSDAAGDLSLPQPAASAPLSVCGLDAPAGSSGRLDRDLHVVALARGRRLGVYFRSGPVLHVRIVSPADPHGARERNDGTRAAEELGGFLGSLQKAGLVPGWLDLSRSSAAAWRSPGGAALELEGLLAKRTLLIGTAGGFASALTGQTLDAGVRSALVAAEVADEALSSRQVQEALAEYKTRWRPLLADRIRPPGTGLHMLLPMVLTNPAITAKFARAFLYGESL